MKAICLISLIFIFGCSTLKTNSMLFPAQEPNAMIEEGMSESAISGRVFLTKVCFGFGLVGSSVIRLIATPFQCIHTQLAKAKYDDSNQLTAFTYGTVKGINCIAPQLTQECIQTPASILLTLGASLFGNQHYYFVPTVDKPHWLARSNWSNRWWLHLLQLPANMYGIFSVTLGFQAITAGVSSILTDTMIAAHPQAVTLANAAANGARNTLTTLAWAVPSSTYATTNLVDKGTKYDKVFPFLTDYDRVWQIYYANNK